MIPPVRLVRVVFAVFRVVKCSSTWSMIESGTARTSGGAPLSSTSRSRHSRAVNTSMTFSKLPGRPCLRCDLRQFVRDQRPLGLVLADLLHGTLRHVGREFQQPRLIPADLLVQIRQPAF